MNKRNNSGLGIAGFVLGICALCLSCILVGGFFGLIGLIFCLVALRDTQKSKGLTVVGLILNVLALCVAMFIFIGMLSDPEEVTKVEQSPQTTMQSSQSESTQTVTPSTENTDTLLRVGETGEYKNVRATLNSVTESNGSAYNTPSDGNVFLLAEFTIENNTDSDLAVSSMLSFDAYQDGYATNLSLTALIEASGEQLDGTIAPGKKFHGFIGYEVPADYSTFEINFAPSVWSNKKFSFIYEK